MRITRIVTWEDTVFPAWQRCANSRIGPDSDIWRPLPQHLCWAEAIVEAADLDRIYLIAVHDVHETFGTWRLCEIEPNLSGDDPYEHKARARAIVSALGQGCAMPRSILIAQSSAGPFVVLDGNHRCLAYHNARCMVGQQVYLGVGVGLFRDYRLAPPGI